MNADYDLEMREEAEKHGFGVLPDGTTHVGVGADFNVRRVVMNFGNMGYCMVYPEKALELSEALRICALSLKGECN